MRVFRNLPAAIKEIKRDLSKSPEMDSPTIQNLEVDGLKVREAMSYTYTLMDVPIAALDLIKEAQKAEYPLPEDLLETADWMSKEIEARIYWQPGAIYETQNPHLKTVLEGSEPSYSYTDRLFGMLQVLGATLVRNPDSRRAYWPMFIPEDSLRAPRHTRIPCTIGYWAAIREVNGVKRLHFTYLQRSCDFRRFWLFDVWFARRLQFELFQYLKQYMRDLEMGHLTHTILSFHVTLDEVEEIY